MFLHRTHVLYLKLTNPLCNTSTSPHSIYGSVIRFQNSELIFMTKYQTRISLILLLVKLVKILSLSVVGTKLCLPLTFVIAVYIWK